MPKIIIRRKPTFGLKSQVIEMFMDGKRIGYLPKGETIEQEIAPGDHKLKAKIGFYGSRELDFYAGNKETRTFKVSQNFLLTAIVLLVFTILFFVSLRILKTVPGSHYNIIISQIPTALLLIYFLTFGRNRQLIISEGEL